jgi:hypothetical protein
VEEIRLKLSPTTRTTIDETGVILPNDNDPASVVPPPIYWNAAGGLYAYVYLRLASLGIDYVGQSQLVGYPKLGKLANQYQSVAMLNWTTGDCCCVRLTGQELVMQSTGSSRS